VSNGEVFSVNPSPESKDMMLMLPDDFLIIVLVSTEWGMYSIISTMICDFAFSSSLFSGLLILTLPDLAIFSLISIVLNLININHARENVIFCCLRGQIIAQRSVFLIHGFLHNYGKLLYISHIKPVSFSVVLSNNPSLLHYGWGVGSVW